MADVFEVADLLVKNSVRNHGQEIDIIAYSGSYTQGEARHDSNLDIDYNLLYIKVFTEIN